MSNYPLGKNQIQVLVYLYRAQRTCVVHGKTAASIAEHAGRDPSWAVLRCGSLERRGLVRLSGRHYQLAKAGFLVARELAMDELGTRLRDLAGVTAASVRYDHDGIGGHVITAGGEEDGIGRLVHSYDPSITIEVRPFDVEALRDTGFDVDGVASQLDERSEP